MALTLRTDGSSAPNLVGAAWWNDYYDLLTGTMNDQPVTLYYTPASGSNPPTLGLRSNGNAYLLNGYSSTNTLVYSLDASGNVTAYGSFTTPGNVSTSTGEFAWSHSSIASTNPTILGITPSGATDNTVWDLLYIGASGVLDFWDNTNGISCLQIIPNGGGILIGGNAKLMSSGNDVHLQSNNGSGWLYLDYYNRLELTGGVYFDAGGGAYATNFYGYLNGNISGTSYSSSNINTIRNGAGTTVPIYTGTNTPSGPPTGSIWIKA